MRRGRLSYFVAVGLAIAVLPAFAIDPPHDNGGSTDCSLCHTPHGAPGGTLTAVAGNANICQSCHVGGGPAAALPFAEADQALVGAGLPSGTTPSGTSHRWDSGPGGHVARDPANTSTGVVQSGGAFSGRYAKTYTITISAAGDAGVAQFSWSDTQGGGAGGVLTGTAVVLDEGVTVSFSDGAGSPSFVLNDAWNVYVLTDLADPSSPEMLTRLEGGKIMCSTCHDEHSQVKTPFDPGAPAYGGPGTGEGRHFQRIDNAAGQMCLECHAARDVGALASQGPNLSHPIGVPIPGGDYQTPVTIPLDASGNVSCLSCHAMHDPDGSKGLPDNGTLVRLADTVALCTDCHTLADTVTPASHFDAVTGVLWPGGEYGSPPSTFPAITDPGKRGSCVNCHQPHGYPDAAAPSQDYASLLVDNASANLCFTCHDSTGPATADIYGAFNGTTNYQDQSGSNALINQRHDVSTTDQSYSGGVVACSDCHNPHLATSAEKVIDPDSPTAAFAGTYAVTNSYTRDGYNFTYDSGGNLDPMNPIGCTGQPATVGSAVEGTHNGDDLGISGGTYSGGVDQTYTVTVSTGGAPPAAQIMITSTGADSSGPTTVTAFNTPIAVGTLGATISFSDGGSGGTPSAVGAASCTAGCAAQWVGTSGGSYSGPANGTYSIQVTTGGAPGSAVLTCTSNISGDACNPSQDYIWASDGGVISIGSYGVTIAIADNQGAASLSAGTTWQIAVTAAAGDGVLSAGDTWTIAATASTAGCSTDAEPDMVTFCLVCHDNNPPPGVTMSPSLLNVADAYQSADQHGRIAGNNGGNGYMKAPWQNIGVGPWASSELANPYAALQCNTCHDGHGSDNIFHLKTSINVRGIQMTVGGGPGSGFEVADGFTSFGSTTYTLPCFSGTTQVDCSVAGGTQVDHKWGGFCTFCHDMQTHGQAEDNTCRSGHMHGGGAF